MQARLQSGHAKIPAPPFGEGPVEIHLAVLFEVREVLQNNLVLQCNGGRGNNQGFAQGFGHGNRRYKISQGLAGTGPRLDNARRSRRGSLAIILGDLAHVFCNFGDHQPLAVAGTDILACQYVAVALLNLLLGVVGQRHYRGLTQSRTTPTRKR